MAQKVTKTKLFAKYFGSKDFRAQNHHPMQINGSVQEPHTRQRRLYFALSISKVLMASVLSNQRNFETEGDTPEKHGVKLLNL